MEIGMHADHIQTHGSEGACPCILRLARSVDADGGHRTWSPADELSHMCQAADLEVQEMSYLSRFIPPGTWRLSSPELVRS
jgi:hypothetical protein